MRAVRMTRPEPGAAEYIVDAPEPEARTGQVCIRVAKAAICGTDRHIYHWDESVRRKVQPPVIIGHEFCGYIESVSGEANGWRPGDYVSAEMHLVCYECRACRRGHYHVCERTRIAGLEADGAFAEYVVVPTTNLVRLDPEVVPPDIGCFLDALGNAVHTVEAAESVAGKHVLVSGYGAIGAMAAAVVVFEKAASLTITEISPKHLVRAQEWASTVQGDLPVHIFDPRTEGNDETVAAVRDATEGGVDVILEMSGAPAAINAGMEMLYPGGEMMQLGIPSKATMPVEDFNQRFIFKGLTWKAVIGRRMFETWDKMLDLLGRGLELEHIVTHRLPMTDFHEGIRLLDDGEAHKVVLDPQDF